MVTKSNNAGRGEDFPPECFGKLYNAGTQECRGCNHSRDCTDITKRSRENSLADKDAVDAVTQESDTFTPEVPEGVEPGPICLDDDDTVKVEELGFVYAAGTMSEHALVLLRESWLSRLELKELLIRRFGSCRGGVEVLNKLVARKLVVIRKEGRVQRYRLFR